MKAARLVAQLLPKQFNQVSSSASVSLPNPTQVAAITSSAPTVFHSRNLSSSTAVSQQNKNAGKFKVLFPDFVSGSAENLDFGYF